MIWTDAGIWTAGAAGTLCAGWLLFQFLPQWRIRHSEPIVRQRLIARGVLPLGTPPAQPKRRR